MFISSTMRPGQAILKWDETASKLIINNIHYYSLLHI